MQGFKLKQVCELLDVPHWRIYKAERKLPKPIVRKRPHQVRWYTVDEILALADYLDVPAPEEITLKGKKI